MQWLQDANQSKNNVNNRNNIRYEASRHFRNKKKEYLKAKIDELETVFWLGGGTISLSCSRYMGLVMLGKQKYVHTAELLVPEPRVL